MSSERPRTAVIFDAWLAAAINAPALVNKKGLPLARTMKCLLDPLIFRPRHRKNLGKAVLNADDAEEMRQLLADAKDSLEWTSLWYLEFKKLRSELGITDGNPQELYFPRSFELAVTFGAPEGCVREIISERLELIHGLGPGIGELTDVLTAATTSDFAHNLWAAAWLSEDPDVDAQGIGERLQQALLDATGQDLDAFVATEDVRCVAYHMRNHEGAVADVVRSVWPSSQAVPLSMKEPLLPPEMLGTATLPLDRTVEQRCRAALRRHRETNSEADAEEIVNQEIERVADAFGLHDGASQALFLVGAVVAPQLNPLLNGDDESVAAATGFAGELQQRLQREAYIMHLRRELCSGAAIHPQQVHVVAELQEFWKPWLNRLWSRLHGREVGPQFHDDRPGELLTGITRSVMLDHRSRIRQSLERSAL